MTETSEEQLPMYALNYNLDSISNLLCGTSQE